MLQIHLKKFEMLAREGEPRVLKDLRGKCKLFIIIFHLKEKNGTTSKFTSTFI